MRWLFFLSLASCAELGLGVPSRVLVHVNKGDGRTPSEAGRELELRHLETGGFQTQKPGYVVVREPDDWLKIWSDPRPDKPRPPHVPEINFDKTILISAVASTPNANAIEIDKVVATENNALQVYVVEHLPGDGCPDKLPKDPPMDVVAADKPVDAVTFWVDRDVGVSCGAKPTARVLCRVMSGGPAGTPSDKLTVAPGMVVNCDGVKSDAGSARAIMDRNWFFTLAPSGSTSKMKLSEGEMSTTFAIDAYGTYSVRLEVVDDEGRSNDGVATIESAPPKDETIVQMGWGKITAQDDPDTFPRVELHVTETPTRSECSSAIEQRPSWCKMSSIAALHHVRVTPADKRFYKYEVKYLDTRYQGGPQVCLRVFPKGQKPAQVCDDEKRPENTKWEVGFLDFDTGTFSEKEPKKEEPKKEEPQKK